MKYTFSPSSNPRTHTPDNHFSRRYLQADNRLPHPTKMSENSHNTPAWAKVQRGNITLSTGAKSDNRNEAPPITKDSY
jgi:hypothetical protein